MGTDRRLSEVLVLGSSIKSRNYKPEIILTHTVSSKSSTILDSKTKNQLEMWVTHPQDTQLSCTTPNTSPKIYQRTSRLNSFTKRTISLPPTILTFLLKLTRWVLAGPQTPNQWQSTSTSNQISKSRFPGGIQRPPTSNRRRSCNSSQGLSLSPCLSNRLRRGTRPR